MFDPNDKDQSTQTEHLPSSIGYIPGDIVLEYLEWHLKYQKQEILLRKLLQTESDREQSWFMIVEQVKI